MHAKTLHLVETLHHLDKSFSNTSYKYNAAFCFACARFPVVSYPINSNQRQCIVLNIYKITLFFNMHLTCPIDFTVQKWLNLKYLLFYNSTLSHACFSLGKTIKCNQQIPYMG